MAIVIDEYTLTGIVFFLILAGRVINQQGGMQIVWWRIWGTRWFMRVEKQPDGTAVRKAYKWKGRVKEHSLPMYEHNGKDWFVGTAKETVRVYGGPQWVYNYNDSRPLPLEHLEMKMVEVEEKQKNPDGSETTVKSLKPMVIAGAPIDPMLIHAGFENKSIEAFNHLSDKPRKLTWGILGFVITIILIVSIFNLVYTYYYGVNIACAIHAHGVNCT